MTVTPTADAGSADAHCLAVPQDGALLQDPANRAFGAAGGFAGRAGEVLLAPGELPTLWVGCGPADRITPETVRECFGVAGRRLGHLGAVTVDHGALLRSPLAEDTITRAVALGLRLGEYRFDTHLPDGRRPATTWLSDADREAWTGGLDLADRVCRARDAVNEPGNVLTPAALARLCVEAGTAAGLEVHVRDETWLEEHGAGGILAIGRSSAHRPMMVEIVHAGAGAPRPDLCLAGKGVTFDTGGLSLKGADAMVTMQHDMASVAAILHAMTLLPAVAPDLHVRAFCPLVENMIGPGAARPGDIVTSRNGKTVEILNSDFEGRVILADALAFASEHRPAALVDIATLTYGAIAALGPRMAALFGDDAASELVEGASRASGEPVWRLPLQEYLAETVRSRVAAVRNFPGLPEARATTAALFLREFVDPDIPWAHLDIAGPAWSAEPHGATPQGGTGYGVQLLAELFRTLGPPAREAAEASLPL
ncbi:leucyl aminopeptidase family protein [Streptomyces sp. NPDC047000]|uniref:leucyl aminopeptidase family protein n=1 Tax=Streptomyces sp. NPDC047000 TaxID=3155474 RepID=UPI003403B62B